MTDSTTDTDRLAEARARYESTSTRDTGAEAASIEAMRVVVAYKDLLATAPADIAFLLSLVDSLQERLDTAEGRVLIEQGEVIKRDKAIDRLERALDEQRWYGEQLQSSIDACSGNHLEIEEYPGDDGSGVSQ